MTLRLGDYSALTFDCYGTLIDWESGLLSVLRPWAEANRLTVSDADLLAAFSEAEPRCEHDRPTAPYRDILRAVHRELAHRFNIDPTTADAERLADSVGDWPPFPDTVEALQRLQRRYKLVIVSNVDKVSFARTNEKLRVRFDAIVTAEEVGAYKPDHRMFHRAIETLSGMGVDRSRILHVAESLYHDHEPAQALGLRTVWINRRHGKTGPGATRAPQASVMPDLTVATLAKFADLV